MTIFPRTRQNSNVHGCTSAAGRNPWPTLIYMMSVLSLNGCAIAPSTPANVIREAAHNNGYVLAFDNRSETLASGGSEGRIRLWQLPDGKPITDWEALTDSVEGLQFLHQDKELISAGFDGVLARWTRAGTLIAKQTTPAPFTSMIVNEPAGLILTGHDDGHVRTWRLADLSLVNDLPLHHSHVLAVAWHPASGQFASSGTDGRVYYWHQNEKPRALPSPPTDARGIVFSPDGKWLMGGGWFKLFRWRLNDGTLDVLPTEHHGIIKSIDYSRDGKTLASISRQLDSSVYFLDPMTGAMVRRFQPHELCGTFIRLSPDGNYLASTSDDGSVRIWDLRHPLPERNSYYETR